MALTFSNFGCFFYILALFTLVHETFFPSFFSSFLLLLVYCYYIFSTEKKTSETRVGVTYFVVSLFKIDTLVQSLSFLLSIFCPLLLLYTYFKNHCRRKIVGYRMTDEDYMTERNCGVSIRMEKSILPYQK